MLCLHSKPPRSYINIDGNTFLYFSYILLHYKDKELTEMS